MGDESNETFVVLGGGSVIIGAITYALSWWRGRQAASAKAAATTLDGLSRLVHLLQQEVARQATEIDSLRGDVKQCHDEQARLYRQIAILTRGPD
jgi:hypothetical protein